MRLDLIVSIEKERGNMTFHAIAARVRSKQWDNEWIEELCMHYLPDELLHTFACDCALHALQREKQQGREPYLVVWEVLKEKRRWLRNEVRYVQIDAAFERAHSAVGYTPLHTPKNSSFEATIDAVLEAANEEPVQAALGAAWAAARAAAKSTRDVTGGNERAWQVERLATLCEAWGMHGEDAARILNVD